MKKGYVYILANKRNGTLYTGATSNLLARISHHKKKLVKGFSEKYTTDILVYFEYHESLWDALDRERKIKRWKRAWKLQLIESLNPDWQDLYFSLT